MVLVVGFDGIIDSTNGTAFATGVDSVVGPRSGFGFVIGFDGTTNLTSRLAFDSGLDNVANPTGGTG